MTHSLLEKTLPEDMHPRERKIVSGIALGTFDPNTMIGADFLAIRNFETMDAIKPIWIKKRRETHTGADGWAHIHRVWLLMRFEMYPGLDAAEREKQIKRQEEIERRHNGDQDSNH